MKEHTVNSNMLYSRKFRAAMLDAIISIGLMWIGYLVNDPALLNLIIATIAAIQVPLSMYIIGVAIEDAAAKRAPQNIAVGEIVESD